MVFALISVGSSTLSRRDEKGGGEARRRFSDRRRYRKDATIAVKLAVIIRRGKENE